MKYMNTAFVALAAMCWGLSGGIGGILTDQGWDPVVVSFYRDAIGFLLVSCGLHCNRTEAHSNSGHLICGARRYSLLSGRPRSDCGRSEYPELATVRGSGSSRGRIVVHFLYNRPEPYRAGCRVHCGDG